MRQTDCQIWDSKGERGRLEEVTVSEERRRCELEVEDWECVRGQRVRERDGARERELEREGRGGGDDRGMICDEQKEREENRGKDKIRICSVENVIVL